MLKLIKQTIRKQHFLPIAPLVVGCGMWLKQTLSILNQCQSSQIHFDQHKNSFSWSWEQLKQFGSELELTRVQILKSSHAYTLELCCLALLEECFSNTNILVLDVTVKNSSEYPNKALGVLT